MSCTEGFVLKTLSLSSLDTVCPVLKALSLSLSRLLSEESTLSCSLENLVGMYHRHFSRQDSYRVGSALSLLLKLRDLLPTPAQRIAAMALLHELYRSDSFSSNPFCLFFAELLQPTVEEGRGQGGVTTTERWFLAQILSPAFPREVCVCVYVCACVCIAERSCLL